MEKHRKILHVCFCIYLLAIVTSRPLMQIFAWISVLLTLSYVIRKSDWPRVRQVLEIFPWKILVSFFAVIVIGLITNSVPKDQFIAAISGQSYMIFLAAFTIILSRFNFTKSQLQLFLVVTGVIAIYAIFQSFTGLDILRPDSNRAVNPVYIGEAEVNHWRSAGLFESPIHYGFVAAMHACIAVATLFHPVFKNRLLYLSGISTLLIIISVITSFTRGAWVALAAGVLVMAFTKRPKLGFKLTAAGGVLAPFILLISPMLRDRFLSIFDGSFSSNSLRVFFWKINWAMFLDYPLFGIGYGQNEVRAKEYADQTSETYAYLSHAHSNYIQSLSGTGAIGLFFYLLLAGYFLKLTFTLYRQLADHLTVLKTLVLGSLGAQVVVHVGGLTDVTFKAIPINHNLMVAWAIVIAAHLFLKPTEKSVPK